MFIYISQKLTLLPEINTTLKLELPGSKTLIHIGALRPRS